MIIETNRMLLRPMCNSDIEDFYDTFSSKEVGRFVHMMTHEDVEKYFERKVNQKPNPYCFAAVLKENNKMIGTCEIRYDEDNNCGELSYVFNAKYWNNGYCTEACKEIVKHCFLHDNMHRIEADCFEDNYASIKILSEKLKMNYEGQLKDYEYNSSTNKITSFNFYGFTKDEYLERSDKNDN